MKRCRYDHGHPGHDGEQPGTGGGGHAAKSALGAPGTRGFAPSTDGRVLRSRDGYRRVPADTRTVWRNWWPTGSHPAEQHAAALARAAAVNSGHQRHRGDVPVPPRDTSPARSPGAVPDQDLPRITRAATSAARGAGRHPGPNGTHHRGALIDAGWSSSASTNTRSSGQGHHRTRAVGPHATRVSDPHPRRLLVRTAAAVAAASCRAPAAHDGGGSIRIPRPVAGWSGSSPAAD
jgi:hypothetical protein